MELTIPRRFCGPPDSGNGGWVSGALAALVPTTPERPAVSVRLASPPPLDRGLAVLTDPPDAETGASRVRLLDGDQLVASATAAPEPGHVDGPGDGTAPATLEEAEAAEGRYEGLADHPFPTCVVCGTDRDPADALCLRPGSIGDGTGRYACTWHVPADVDAPLVWAALDCPGGWSAGIAGRPMVLGTMTAVVHTVPEPGSTTVVTAWQTGAEGRRHWSASTLHTPTGVLLAHAEAVWIAVDPTSVRPRERR
jgi:hypothetical protein